MGFIGAYRYRPIRKKAYRSYPVVRIFMRILIFQFYFPIYRIAKIKEQKRPSIFGKVYYQTKKKKLSKPDELRPNSSILFTGFLVLIRYFVSMYISFLILYQAIFYHGKRLFNKSSLLLMCAHWFLLQ